MTGAGAFCLVSFHAHPDDEALLTGGSLAKAAAAGHRVVLVVATLGERGMTDPGAANSTPLGLRRYRELLRSAAELGCSRVEWLGYQDSGWGDSDATGRGDIDPPFSLVDCEEAAERLAAILRRERADVLTTYDPAGGYGHPDHVQVHRVGARAAELAGTAVVLEATVDRSLLVFAARWLRRMRWLVPGLDLPEFENAFTARRDLTHRIDVRDQLEAKRRAMAAHATQTTGGSGRRTLRFFLRLPRPLFRAAFGHEWFVERGRPAPATPQGDLFDSLRAGSAATSA